ncbi:MAG: type II toxin-antitoxin system death-on-curing family toxin [SAR86 cluster bacterium]|uniref:Type II toxin-antitoxin system death-on-curing family toxin n=1 Tax=SAR86 cluster bacterium TaxID=2030880 RepID=A0A2A5CHC3_9GAMM|nr:MAG: type II toxin-antitoxin system death-on-curing family toxin [SAR86 cluster bacterium]
MKEPTWVLADVALAVHSLVLAEHGGESGIRDSALLSSALTRPKQKFNYEPDISIFELAASYSFGLAKNHPFIDGNKRVAFTVGVLFLELNEYLLKASEPEAVITFESLTEGKITETELAQWFTLNSDPA